MSRKNNLIYSSLVKDNNDIIGHIAYSLYESDKLEFIERYQETNAGKTPDDNELEIFLQAHGVDGHLSRYRMKATAILQSFCQETLQETIHDIEKEYLEKQDDHFRRIVSELTPHSWKAIGLNSLYSAIAAFILALLGAAFGFINLYSGE